jgi:2-succinyl-5-enolpyruvyl-6-hydroxy-3-cyclohexene-1-carboxylate synthase
MVGGTSILPKRDDFFFAFIFFKKRDYPLVILMTFGTAPAN